MRVSDRRAARKREILDATRALFDERGVRDAQIEDIARAVGINRAIIYRHFTGKEELFAETLVGYLAELESALAGVDDPAADPEARLRAITLAFLDFGERLPAFVDCANTLIGSRGEDLLTQVNEDVLLRLGHGMATCLRQVVTILDAGVEAGVFAVEDPNLLANLLYAQGLGALNLVTLQLSVSETPGGAPVVAAVPLDQVRRSLVRAALAMARGD